MNNHMTNKHYLKNAVIYLRKLYSKLNIIIIAELSLLL